MKLGPEGRGWLYVTGLITVGALILLIDKCANDSAFALNPEKWNLRYVVPVIGAALAVFFYFLWKQNKK